MKKRNQQQHEISILIVEDNKEITKFSAKRITIQF